MSSPTPEMSAPELHNGALREPIPSGLLGSAVLDRTGDFVAGSFQSFSLTYTAGRFGIDDSGSVRIAFRFATDQSNPQFSDPAGPNFTVVTASNKAVLDCRFDPKGNIRPWDRTLQIKVVKGFMREGDTIAVRFGVTDHGSPGMRLQTFCEERFEFRVLVDPIATYNFQPLPDQPHIRIVPGAAERWVAVLPTDCLPGEPFRLRIKAEDRWGNPTNQAAGPLRLEANQQVENLPQEFDFPKGEFAAEIDELATVTEGPLSIALFDTSENEVARTNPSRVVAAPELRHFWGDLHGQSDETLGTNSAADYFAFGRDRAFLDACAHQGNDFQMTETFWRDLNRVTAHFNEPGRFVTLPGYEWSGNTALGGDRNVFFPAEGRTMRRSSHALIEDQSDADTDCHTAGALFESFATHGEWDVICWAHCGGRYADIVMAHDGRFEKSVEVHSAWGTFEWLVEDAFRMGYRVGIVGNSDGHKGRPGASYPGAGWFGAVGGLTCYLMPELTRDNLLDCLRHRRHYATTGGPSGRIRMELSVTFDSPATVYHDNPAICDSRGAACSRALMGDIVHLSEGGATLQLEVSAAAPVQRVDLFNGAEHLESFRPYAERDLGNRIAVIWEGAEYRGRFRAVTWDGSAQFDGTRVIAVEPVNFFNRDKTLDHVNGATIAWQSVTTGNQAGFIASLAEGFAGSMTLCTPLIEATLPLAGIGLEDTVLDASGTLPRRVRMYRLPDENPHLDVSFERPLFPVEGRDNPYFVRVTLEDGTIAWSTPVYIIRSL